MVGDVHDLDVRIKIRFLLFKIIHQVVADGLMVFAQEVACDADIIVSHHLRTYVWTYRSLGFRLLEMSCTSVKGNTEDSQNCSEQCGSN